MEMNKKIAVAIDIDEILRSKWLQFDKYYVEEFGEDGVPQENPYCFDYFSCYTWKDTVERIKYLKEPEETPETINPLDYQVDDDGESLADGVLFNREEKTNLTAKDVYNRFMFEDYCFEIHGAAPVIYKNVDLILNNFYRKYNDQAEFYITSKENSFTIPHTLFFLSKVACKIKNYKFVERDDELWNNIDVLITTSPEAIKNKPENKVLIKLNRPYNKECGDNDTFDLGIENPLHIADVLDNENFEKLIGYKKPQNDNDSE